MSRFDQIGFEQAAAISLNYALDSVETEIQKELKSGSEITTETLHRLLSVIRKQRVSGSPTATLQ